MCCIDLFVTPETFLQGRLFHNWHFCFSLSQNNTRKLHEENPKKKSFRRKHCLNGMNFALILKYSKIGLVQCINFIIIVFNYLFIIFVPCINITDLEVYTILNSQNDLQNGTRFKSGKMHLRALLSTIKPCNPQPYIN